ncbi:Carbohydrate-binding X8 domain superfamily protein [Euphorbia peplus]|nr:Carbohydrate-binding X8 domain superfamily protein [Euphorbia peplus]
MHISQSKMSNFVPRIMLLVLLVIISVTPQRSDAKEWCIASLHASDQALQVALDWACGHGADCSSIQPGKPCFIPNNVRGHASIALNDYFQRFKHRGGSCNFNGAAFTVYEDPSYGACHYLFIP